MDKTYTIKDIAKELGLSHGTVDRVIHQRGGVSEKTQRRIQKFLDEINFKPNVLARSLKGSRLFKLSVLLPSYTDDAYWAKAAYGVAQAKEEFRDFSLAVDLLAYQVDSANEFEQMAAQLVEAKPDGVLIAPLFYRESVKFIQACKEKNIPVLTFNTLLEKDSDIGFIGQNLRQSGRLGAELVKLKRPQNTNGFLIVHIEEDPGNAVHMSEKEKGFRDFFERLKQSESSDLLETLKLDGVVGMDVLKKRLLNEVSGIFVTTSKVYKVAQLLEDLNLTDIPLIGYDLIDENIEFLKRGTIDFLINQNPVQQASKGVRSLFDFIVFNKDLPHRQLLPLDIITTQNYQSYLEEGGMDINRLIFDKKNHSDSNNK